MDFFISKSDKTGSSQLIFFLVLFCFGLSLFIWSGKARKLSQPNQKVNVVWLLACTYVVGKSCGLPKTFRN